jgi:apolipoprotein N-acyltransferase
VTVQPNIDEETQWTAERVDELQRRLVARSLEHSIDARQSPPALILWPEAPAPLYFYEDVALRTRLEELTRTTRAHALAGTVAHDDRGSPLNSAVMLAPDGRLLGRYDKIKLVPFGEFIPPMFGWINQITTEAGEFKAGDSVVVFDAGGRRVGAFICYESVFPDLVRQFAKSGAEVLVNLSNDGYFARSAAREQHLSIVRMRAAENRRWILRSTNDGITAAVDPAGRVTRTLPPFLETSARLQFSYEAAVTPYTRFGDWFAWGCLIVGVGLAIGDLRSKAGGARPWRAPGS